MSSLDSAPLVGTVPSGSCTVCGLLERANYATGRDFELETCANRWVFMKCSGCGHIMLDPRPDEAALPIIYPSHYYSYDLEKSVSRLALRAKELLDRRKFRKILRFLGHNPTRYFDIGCGDGRYLKLLEGWMQIPKDHLHGLELDERVVRGLQQDGYGVEAQRLESSQAIRDQKFDLVTLFHVIEHLADPGESIRQISDSLLPGGVLVLETPCLDSIDARWFKRTFWGGYHIPRHWHLFSTQTLSTLVENSGLQVVAVRYTTGHSFWMYSFHHLFKFGLGGQLRWLAPTFNPLRSLLPLAVFTCIDTLRSALGFKTSAVLLIARKSGASPSGADSQ
jgi:SAM-dependent methyltransferase